MWETFFWCLIMSLDLKNQCLKLCSDKRENVRFVLLKRKQEILQMLNFKTFNSCS